MIFNYIRELKIIYITFGRDVIINRNCLIKTKKTKKIKIVIIKT